MSGGKHYEQGFSRILFNCYVGFYPNKRMKDPKEYQNEIGEDLLTIAAKREAKFFISESGKNYAHFDLRTN